MAGALSCAVMVCNWKGVGRRHVVRVVNVVCPSAVIRHVLFSESLINRQEIHVSRQMI